MIATTATADNTTAAVSYKQSLDSPHIRQTIVCVSIYLNSLSFFDFFTST